MSETKLDGWCQTGGAGGTRFVRLDVRGVARTLGGYSAFVNGVERPCRDYASAWLHVTAEGRALAALFARE